MSQPILVEMYTKCPECKKDNPVFSVDKDALKAYMDGALVQKAFPNLTDQQREYIVTGYCEACWDKLFPEVD